MTPTHFRVSVKKDGIALTFSDGNETAELGLSVKAAREVIQAMIKKCFAFRERLEADPLTPATPPELKPYVERSTAA
jgi:hypothetical protein